MRVVVLLILCLFGLRSLSWAAAAEETLQPGAVIRLEFPELPSTLATMSGEGNEAPRLTAKLPTKYTATGKFPLFIMLEGNDGGHGDLREMNESIVGRDDYVQVALPLFKRSVDRAGPYGGKLIGEADYATLSVVYRTMLQRLFEKVPNVTPQRSAIGGFSNGAHGLAVLIARRDPFLLAHFDSFFFFDGGFDSLTPAVVRRPELAKHRLAVFLSDQPPSARQVELAGLGEKLAQEARAAQLDFSCVIMRGANHEMPPAYLKSLGDWLRGGRLP